MIKDKDIIFFFRSKFSLERIEKELGCSKSAASRLRSGNYRLTKELMRKPKTHEFRLTLAAQKRQEAALLLHEAELLEQGIPRQATKVVKPVKPVERFDWSDEPVWGLFKFT